MPAEPSFEVRLSKVLAQIQRDRENPPHVVLEGTDEFAERQRLQHYDDPLAATKEGDTHAE